MRVGGGKGGGETQGERRGNGSTVAWSYWDGHRGGGRRVLTIATPAVPSGTREADDDSV